MWCWGKKPLSGDICHRDGQGGTESAGLLLSLAWGRAAASPATGKIAVWMEEKREQHIPAMILIWNKEWARGPTVLQSCTVCRQPTLEL